MMMDEDNDDNAGIDNEDDNEGNVVDDFSCKSKSPQRHQIDEGKWL